MEGLSVEIIAKEGLLNFFLSAGISMGFILVKYKGLERRREWLV